MLVLFSWDKAHVSENKAHKSFQNKEKSFQIILPSDVDIALASVYCLRATESVLGTVYKGRPPKGGEGGF